MRQDKERKARMKDIVSLHSAEFDARPAVIAKAPGVVKLLGEHTEHADGIVLAVTTSFSVQVAISERKDSALRYYAADFNERKRTTVSNLKYKREDRWANLLKAPLAVLTERGLAPSGYSFTVSGDIPQSLGFGSSTAIIIATIFALKSIRGLKLSEEEIIDIALESESDFLGSEEGAVEASAALYSRKDHAVLYDIKKRSHSLLPFPLKGHSLVFTDSRVPRFLADSELKSRQTECRRCLHAMVSPKRPLKSLRDANFDDLSESVGSIPESARRRCSFVMEEYVRALEAAECLQQGDIPGLGKLIVHSHDGLRDLYEISCPEIDWLVKRALEVEGCAASRMIGSGFGGCTLSLMKSAAAADYRSRIEEYERIFGFKPTIKVSALGERAGILR
jgi:galactokinase